MLIIQKILKRATITSLAVCLLFFNVSSVGAVPNYYQSNIKLETFINDGSITQPTAFQIAPDGRMFIAQRNGDVKIVWKGHRTASGLKHIDVDTSQEHGLLNMVLDPNFATNPYAYFYYNGTDSKVRIAKAKVGLDYIEPLQVLWTARGPSTSPNHQGGGLDVDNYGQILFSTGDNYVSSYAQDPTNDYGKVFRIKTDGTAPSSNPYLTHAGASPALFAIGVRNPFRLTVDRLTNTVYLGDVGQSSYEEINKIDMGKNYGWPYQEGAICTGDCSNFVTPLYTYAHPPAGNYFTTASVTLGHSYYGNYYGGALDNTLLFADGMQGRIDALSKTGTPERVLSGVGYIVDTAQDNEGRIYLLDYYAGKVSRINYGANLNDEPYANPSCTPANTTANTQISCKANAGDQNNDPLTYKWELGDGRTQTTANPTFSYAEPGQYKVRLTLSDGKSTLPYPPITINVGSQPHVELISPDITTPVKAGSTINYQIEAKEADGTIISDDNVKTTVKFHHNTHAHDFVTDKPGKTNSFAIPTNIETDLDIWLRLYISVTDKNGATTTIERDLYYNEATLTLDSTPKGAPIMIDGTVASHEDGFVGVSGILRTLEAPEVYTSGGQAYRFSKWSDGSAEHQRQLAFPDQNTKLTAIYTYDPNLNTSDSLIKNGSFEATNDQNTAIDWQIIAQTGAQGSTTFSAPGHDNSKACTTTITQRQGLSQRGCATVAPIDENKTYSLENWYKANRYSYLFAEYYNDNNFLKKEQVAKPVKKSEWTKLSLTLQPPATANKVKIYQVIDGVGTLVTDDYSLLVKP